MVSTPQHAANRQRRTPVQERSQTTVARILGAASHLLAKRQLGEITTNQIARQAKLSVGALYRFFPDKQAIVDALAARHAEDLYAAALALLMQGTPTDGPAFLSAVIDAYAEFLDRRPDFRTIVFGRHISAKARRRNAAPDAGVASLVGVFMSGLAREDGAEDIGLRLRVAIETGERLIAYAFEQPSREERLRVIEQTKRLLAGYLFPA